MRLLFLGYVVSVEEANELSGASVAGNTMQLDLLRQLRELPDVEVYKERKFLKQVCKKVLTSFTNWFIMQLQLRKEKTNGNTY